MHIVSDLCFTPVGNKGPKQAAVHVPTDSQGNGVLSQQAVRSQRPGRQKLHVR